MVKAKGVEKLRLSIAILAYSLIVNIHTGSSAGTRCAGPYCCAIYSSADGQAVAGCTTIHCSWLRTTRSGIAVLLLNREHLRDVIEHAILFADMIKRDPKFPVDYKELVVIQCE